MNIYLASRYQDHPLMRQWRDQLVALGHSVTSRWIEGDHEITGANDDLERSRFAFEDMADLRHADLVICRSDPSFFRTGRGGRHVEFGLALAWDIPIILVGERENVFHWLPEVSVVPDFEAALDAITAGGFTVFVGGRT